MSSSHEVEFLGGEMCGADVLTARFSRPPRFTFSPGQWVVLALMHGQSRLSETFTICSAPDDDYLEVTTRLSGSAYKNTLAGMAPGDTAVVTGPGGRLALPAKAARLAFLVGGVGITPVHSMLRDARTHGRVFDDAVLFYGNRDASCVPFREEFAAMAPGGVRMVLCYEDPPQGWSGESGFITAEVVRRYLPGEELNRPFIVAGPPVMVAAMEKVLDVLSVPAESRLVEHFGPRPPSAGASSTGAPLG
jgi:ferredoxin-NADP reductase